MNEKLKSILGSAGIMLKAIIKGEFLMRLHITRYFAHILMAFAMIVIAIWVSLLTDSTMTRVERGKKIIDGQQEEILIRTFEISRLSRRSSVEARLKEMGSDIAEPTSPANTIEE